MMPGRAKRLARLAILLVAAVASACAGVVSFDEYHPKTFTVQGTVSGLDDRRLALELNGRAFEVGDGPFTSPRVADGQTYLLRLTAQPSGRQCSIAGGEGALAGADIMGVDIHCAGSYRIGGTVTGSGAGQVVLTVTQRDPSGSVAAELLGTRDGPFSFRAADGARFSIQVTRASSGHGCTVVNGEGTVMGRDAHDVVVSCAAGGAELGALSVRTCSPDNVDAGLPCDGALVPLVPAFVPDKHAYVLSAHANCGFTKLCASVFANPLYSGAAVNMQGRPLGDGGASILVNRVITASRTIDVDVTGQDGESHEHYVLAVTVLDEQ